MIVVVVVVVQKNVLLKYVPFRVVPSVIGAETTTGEGGVGTQQFTLRDVPQGYVTRNEGYIPKCWVDDTILPEPPLIRNVLYNRVVLLVVNETWHCLQYMKCEWQYNGHVSKSNVKM
jgi:hypothetical protein